MVAFSLHVWPDGQGGFVKHEEFFRFSYEWVRGVLLLEFLVVAMSVGVICRVAICDDFFP